MYTLGTPEEAVKKLQRSEARLQKVTTQLNAARRRMSYQKRKMSGLIDDLANERLISLEAESNLRAQFTGLLNYESKKIGRILSFVMTSLSSTFLWYSV